MGVDGLPSYSISRTIDVSPLRANPLLLADGMSLRHLLRKIALLVLLPAVLGVLPACGSRPFALKNIAKSDVDLVADAHFREVDQLLRTLMIKLYKRNPRELQKMPGATISTRLYQVFGAVPLPDFAELDGRRGVAAIDLCFDREFAGDRVFALVAGLEGMMLEAYNNHSEQFIFDALDEQKLYNSARNVEIVVWRLSNRLDRAGKPILLTNSGPGEEANLSFERLFGKLIALQDMLAHITADREKRTINKVVHSLASAALFPVGM